MRSLAKPDLKVRLYRAMRSLAKPDLKVRLYWRHTITPTIANHHLALALTLQ